MSASVITLLRIDFEFTACLPSNPRPEGAIERKTGQTTLYHGKSTKTSDTDILHNQHERQNPRILNRRSRSTKALVLHPQNPLLQTQQCQNQKAHRLPLRRRYLPHRMTILSPTSNPFKKQPPSKESFESYYLKQVTAEFADDIDKIRNASDFNERSVPVLIQALKQSASNFTEEERERVMGTRR